MFDLVQELPYTPNVAFINPVGLDTFEVEDRLCTYVQGFGLACAFPEERDGDLCDGFSSLNVVPLLDGGIVLVASSQWIESAMNWSFEVSAEERIAAIREEYGPDADIGEYYEPPEPEEWDGTDGEGHPAGGIYLVGAELISLVTWDFAAHLDEVGLDRAAPPSERVAELRRKAETHWTALSDPAHQAELISNFAEDCRWSELLAVLAAERSPD